MAVDGGNGVRITQPQVVELVHVRVVVPGGVHLVHRQNHRLPGALEHPGHLLVSGGHAGADVAYKNDHRGGVNSDLRLLTHKGQNLVVGPRLDAAGVHQVEGAAPPLGLGVQPVAGDARRVLHDGQAFAGQLIEQHGLAHVGAAHNGHQGLCHSIPPIGHTAAGSPHIFRKAAGNISRIIR